MGAYAFAGENNSSSSNSNAVGSPLTAASHSYPSFDFQPNQTQAGKMVRKRAASELDAGYHRFLRRTVPGNSATTTGVSPNPNSNPMVAPDPSCFYLDNHSNHSNILLSSTNTSVTSGGFGSGSGCGFSTTNDHHHPPHLRQNLLQPQTPSPSVCVFSGLPLFPPERSRSAIATQPSPVAADVAPTTTVSVSAPMEDSAAASAWIDGIIKDLIHGSTHISIPHLIQNVREIIHPCNPHLAALLEYRLSCIADPMPNYASDRRRKEAEAEGLQVQHHLLLPNPQGGAGPVQDNLSFSLPGSAPNSLPMNHQYMIQNSPTSVVSPVISSSSNHQQLKQSQHQQQQQDQQLTCHETEKQQTDSPSGEAVPTQPPAGAVAAATREKKEEMNRQKMDEEGLHLLTLLLKCAEAVATDNLEEANKMLLEISQLSTPFGTSAQRVAAYFSEAMSARLVNSCLGIYATLPTIPSSQTQKMVSAFQVFNGISPFVKFSHFTANQAIQARS